MVGDRGNGVGEAGKDGRWIRVPEPAGHRAGFDTGPGATLDFAALSG